MNSKRCFKCFETKPIGQFYKHRQMADGHLNKCKECTKKDVGIRYYTQFEKIRDYEKRRTQTERRKEKVLEYQKTRRANRPERYKAYNAVSNAIRSGKLTRQPCEICGEEKSQAHHDDYSKPLDVKWLCFRHHRAIEHHQINAFTS